MHARACVYVYMYVCMYMGKRWREVTMDDVFFIYSNNIFTSVLIPLFGKTISKWDPADTLHCPQNSMLETCSECPIDPD